jgi:hypothetical protein
MLIAIRGHCKGLGACQTATQLPDDAKQSGRPLYHSALREKNFVWPFPTRHLGPSAPPGGPSGAPHPPVAAGRNAPYPPSALRDPGQVSEQP